MGDLADAIREHLELKRRRGADPSEVAREEEEALAPVTRGHAIVAAAPEHDESEPEEPEAPAGEHEPEPQQAALDPAQNGAAAPDRDSTKPKLDAELDDATQEYHIGHGDPLGHDWLEESS